MKKMTKIVAIFLSGVMLFSSSTCFTATAKDSTPCKSLVLLGDEALTWRGLDGDLPKDSTCGSLLSKKYGLETGKTYTDLTVGGLTSFGLLTSFTDKSKAPIVEGALKNADTVVISIGSNDFMGPTLELLGKTVLENKEELEKAGLKIDSSSDRALFKSIGAAMAADTTGIITKKQKETASQMSDTFSTTTTNAIKNISSIVGEVRKNAPNCKVYVLTMYALLGTTNGYDLTPATKVNNGIKEALQGLAPATEVVDIAPLFEGKGTQLTDILNADIRPNKDGHKVIYDALTAAIESSATSEAVETTVETTVPEITSGGVSCSNLVILGDSLGTGYGLEGNLLGDNTSAKGSFANMLAKKYGLVPGETYTNLAVNGLTTSKLLEGFTDENKAPIVKKALKNADTVVISAGGSDFVGPLLQLLGKTVLQNKEELEKAGFKIDSSSEEALFKSIGVAMKADTKKIIAGKIVEAIAGTKDSFSDIATNAIKNITTIVGEVRKNAPNCKIYVLTMYDPLSGAPGYDVPSTILLNVGIKKSMLALAPGAEAIDIEALFEGKGSLLTNIVNGDINPNKDGHKVIYDALTAAIESSATSEPIETTVPEITSGDVSCSNLVILGDSLGTGYGLEGNLKGDNTSAKGSFANMLAKKYGLVPGETYTNLAVNGLTTSKLLEGFTDENKAPIVKKALANADTVVISAGGNDFTAPLMELLGEMVKQNKEELESAGIKIDSSSYRPFFESLYAAFKADTTGIILDKIKDTASLMPETFSAITTKTIENMSAIVSEVRKNAPKSKIYVLTAYNPFSGIHGGAISTATNAAFKAMNEGISMSLRELSTATEVVDIAPLFDGKAPLLTNILTTDSLPNKDGHKAIYDALTAAIDKNATSEAVETSVPEITEDEPVETTAEVPAVTTEAPAVTTSDETMPANGSTDTNTPDKTSPEAGIEGVGVIIGVGLLGLLGVVIAKKRK